MSAGPVHTGSLPGPGARVAGKYRIERIVGRGGMGIVYAAHHEVLDHRVALKILTPEVAAQPTAVTRFLNEARLAARLRSEHLCQVLDAGVTETGLPYIAMELLEGCDLARLLVDRRAPLPPGEAVEYVIQALDAVSEAHARGVIHRDLKPSNLFLTHTPDGRPTVKVLDFGISKVDDAFAPEGMAPANLTQSRAIIGSPTYMSPEQIQNIRRTDHRTDIWSLGVILYELMTRTQPFRGETPGEIFVRIIEGQLVPPSQVTAAIPKPLSDIVVRCLRRNVDERFDTVASLAEAIAPFAWYPHAESLARMRHALGARGRSGEHSAPGTTSAAIVPPPRASTTAGATQTGAGTKVLIVLAATVPLLLVALAGTFVVRSMNIGRHEPAATGAGAVSASTGATEPQPPPVVAATETATATSVATAPPAQPPEPASAPPAEPSAAHQTTAAPTAPAAAPTAPATAAQTPTAPAVTSPPVTHPAWQPAPQPVKVPTSKRSILDKRN